MNASNLNNMYQKNMSEQHTNLMKQNYKIERETVIQKDERALKNTRIIDNYLTITL